MASTVSLEGAKRAIFFPFQGKNWSTKVVIGAALNFAQFIIPVIPLIALLGYIGQIMRGIIVRDEDPQLPEWKDWGTLFLDGLRMFAVFVIYSLPGILVVLFSYFLMIFVGLGASFVSAFFANPNQASSATPILLSVLANFLGTFGGIVFLWIGIFLFLVSMFLFPPAMGNMFARGHFGAAFRIKEWWPILKANFSGFVLAFAIVLGLGFILVIIMQVVYLTVVLCLLLPFLISFLGFLIAIASYTLYAVAYRDGARLLAGNRQP